MRSVAAQRSRPLVKLWWLAIIVLAGGCSPVKHQKADESGNQDALRGMSGVWKSDGYGLVFVASDDALEAYEVTETTCVPTSKQLARQMEAPPGAEAVYSDGDISLLLRSTSDSNEKTLQVDDAASHMVIRRIAARPATCDHPTPDTPAGNLEVFAQTWIEHYISFDLKGADWPAAVAAAKVQVTPETKPEEFLEFRSPEGKTFDGPGIPPDITVPVYAEQDVTAGRDPALERARVVLYQDR